MSSKVVLLNGMPIEVLEKIALDQAGIREIKVATIGEVVYEIARYGYVINAVRHPATKQIVQKILEKAKEIIELETFGSDTLKVEEKEIVPTMEIIHAPVVFIFGVKLKEGERGKEVEDIKDRLIIIKIKFG